jgi:hypothetical protein
MRVISPDSPTVTTQAGTVTSNHLQLLEKIMPTTELISGSLNSESMIRDGDVIKITTDSYYFLLTTA